MFINKTEPGTVYEADGEEFYAIEKNSCLGCALLKDPRCPTMPNCAGIAWLTKIDYIKHRLAT